MYLKRLIFLISISLLCFNCTNNSNKTDSEDNSQKEKKFPEKLEFSCYYDSVVYHLDNNEEMPSFEIVTNITYPLKTGFPKNDNLLIKSFIANCIGNEYAHKYDIKKAVKSLIEDKISDYRFEICYSTPEDEIIGERWMNHSYIVENNILYNANGILSYSCDTYRYTGGAHGLNITCCYVYDLYNNHELCTRAIFKEEFLPNILSLIKEKLALKEYAELIDTNYVEVTENFFIDKKGFHWIYNQYEIAAYAVGTIEVVIPFSEIENYLIDKTLIDRFI